MAKKLLTETQMRRFAKLANLSPVNEMYNKRDDEKEEVEEGYDMKRDDEEVMKEEESLTEEEPPAPEMDAPMDDAMDDMGADDLELTDEEAQAIIDLGRKLEAAMPDAPMDDEPEMDAPMDDEAPEAEPPPMEENEIMEALSEITYVPEKQEIVEEVARRVAKRLLKAKRAQKSLNEALGGNSNSK